MLHCCSLSKCITTEDWSRPYHISPPEQSGKPCCLAKHHPMGPQTQMEVTGLQLLSGTYQTRSGVKDWKMFLNFHLALPGSTVAPWNSKGMPLSLCKVPQASSQRAASPHAFLAPTCRNAFSTFHPPFPLCSHSYSAEFPLAHDKKWVCLTCSDCDIAQQCFFLKSEQRLQCWMTVKVISAIADGPSPFHRFPAGNWRGKF